MAHDVYICYDENDKKIANKACQALEKKGIKCWFKARDVGVNNIVDEIVEAINDAKLMVLIFSENAKHSNFVNNEVDTAFTAKKQILVYQVDDTKLDGALEFFLNNKPWINAYPNPEKHFNDLSKSVLDLGGFGIWKRHKLPVIIGIVAILIIGGLLVATFGMGSSDSIDSQYAPGDIKLKITDFHMDDVRKSSTSWNYSYYVDGTITPLPDNPNYRILVDFYDKSGNLVNSTETLYGEAQKIGNGFLFGSMVSDTNDITNVNVELLDGNDIVIAQCESQL